MSSPSFGFYTTAEEVASAYADRVRGKTILITGVTPNGLGLYTAKVLAAHSPRLLILAARSTRTLDAAAAEIRHVAPACPTRSLLLDLASTSTVRVAAENLNSWIDMSDIDILINNAAVMSTPWGLSQDGIEQQFATNHIGHFLFTNLIMDKIIAGKGRIINVSSGAHQFGPVRFDDYNFKARHYRGP
jgi:NAD(P)-dependent dehydrogenase (short-subunit alcohol dehydrogenase family)